MGVELLPAKALGRLRPERRRLNDLVVNGLAMERRRHAEHFVERAHDVLDAFL